MVFVEAIVQGKSEPLKDYIERFNKEGVQVRGSDDTIKKYLITKKFFPFDRPRSFNEFLAIAKTYIRYEEELYADILNNSRKEEPVAESSRKPFHDKKNEWKPAREVKGPIGRFSKYTPLAMSREKILAKIVMKEDGIKPPNASLLEQNVFSNTTLCFDDNMVLKNVN